MEQSAFLGVYCSLQSEAIQMFQSRAVQVFQLKAAKVFLLISLAAAIVGVGFVGAAALRVDTGIDGTFGAYLAIMGAVALTLSLAILWTAKLPARVRGIFGWSAVFLAMLTGVAAWFLMQDALFLAMVVAFLALLMSLATTQRKKTH